MFTYYYKMSIAHIEYKECKMNMKNGLTCHARHAVLHVAIAAVPVYFRNSLKTEEIINQ